MRLMLLGWPEKINVWSTGPFRSQDWDGALLKTPAFQGVPGGNLYESVLVTYEMTNPTW